MARRKRKEDLSVEELRRLMIEKRRAERKKTPGTLPQDRPGGFG